MPCAGRLLCPPASTTSVRRRARPSTSAALSPAAPAPTTMQSQVFDTRSSCACGQNLSNSFADMANERPESRRGPRAPPAARAARRARPDAAAGRHAANLDVSTLSRLETASAGWRSTTCPRLAAGARRQQRRPARLGPPQDPRVRSEPIHRNGLTMWPLTHRASSSGLRAYRVEIERRAQRAARPPAGARGLRLDVRPRGPAAPDPGRPRARHRAGRGRRVQHLDAALVRRRSTAPCSSC